MVYITEENEFAVGFDVVLSGFQPYTYKTPIPWKIQTRKRELKPDLNACFPFQGIPAVVMGRWETISSSPGEWVITAVHEMFHVYQLSNGGKEKIDELKLGSQTDASWWLNFPFPYKEKEVMSLIHLQSYLNYLAATMENDEAGSCSGAAREAITIYQNALKRLDPEGQYYCYSKFQEWFEGIALYTENKIAEAAASKNYHPVKGFIELQDTMSYEKLWNTYYGFQKYLAKHAGKAAKSRMAFYHLGLGKGLMLDRYMPEWKSRYFEKDVWLDDLIWAMFGDVMNARHLVVGDIAPDFALPDLDIKTQSLQGYRNKVVLIDFWQTWCGSCLLEMPSLIELQNKYKNQGFTILSIVPLAKPKEVEQIHQISKRMVFNFETLIDEKGETKSKYVFGSYPQLFLIDQNGRIAYKKTGYKSGDEALLEKEILQLLKKGK